MDNTCFNKVISQPLCIIPELIKFMCVHASMGACVRARVCVCTHMHT